MIVGCVVIQILLKRWAVTDFKNLVIFLDKDNFKAPDLNDKADWVYHYTHPFIKGTPFVREYIEHFNVPLGITPQKLRVNNEAAVKRFETQLNKPVETEVKLKTELHSKSSYPRLETPNTKKLGINDPKMRIPTPIDPKDKILRKQETTMRTANNPKLHSLITKGIGFESMRIPKYDENLDSQINIKIYTDPKLEDA